MITELARQESLPIADEAVDYVFANMYLHHVESPPEAIKEMARILKPEGRLIIADLDVHAFQFLKDEHHDRWMGFKREDIGVIKNPLNNLLKRSTRPRAVLVR